MRLTHFNSCEPDAKSPVLARGLVRWLVVLIGFAMFQPALSPGLSAETAALKEPELKAAFIYNFTKFIEWPTNRFQDANSPFVIAVAGSSPCTDALDKIAKERKVHGRTLIIKLVKTPEAATGAHILFVSASEDSRLKEWLPPAHRAGILSVGESEAFSKQGGIISFILEEERIRFDLNIGQAGATGLSISAQLQKLARTVRKKS